MRHQAPISAPVLEQLEGRLLMSSTLTTVFSEGFEGAFPGSWIVSTNKTVGWGKVSGVSYSGNYSCFCAAGTGASTYPVGLDTFLLQRGLVVPESACSAAITFMYRAALGPHANLEPMEWGNPMPAIGPQDNGPWQRFSYRLGTSEIDQNCDLYLRLFSESADVPPTPGGLWIDDIQVVYDDMFDWPDAPLNGAEVYTNQFGNANVSKTLAYAVQDGWCVFFDQAGPVMTATTSGDFQPVTALYEFDGYPTQTDDGGGGTSHLSGQAHEGSATDVLIRDNPYIDPAPGNYTLAVNGPDALPTTLVLDPATGNQASASDVINIAYDCDFFKFTTTYGGRYTISVTPTTDDIDPTMNIFNSSGSPVVGSFTQSRNTGGLGQTEQYTMQNQAAGQTYYVRVDGEGESTGNYNIQVHGIVNGDCNEDDKVDVVDLGLLATNWKQAGPPKPTWAQGNFNDDNIVDVVDLGLLATNWRYPNIPAPAPEISQAISTATDSASATDPETQYYLAAKASALADALAAVPAYQANAVELAAPVAVTVTVNQPSSNDGRAELVQFFDHTTEGALAAVGAGDGQAAENLALLAGPGLAEL